MNPPLAIVIGLLVFGCTLVPTRAASREDDPFDPEAALARCTEQLRGLGRALSAYERDHGELPPRLSDLYPRYVSDPALFHCPADAAQGREGAAGQPDLVVSYNYDMSLDVSPGTFFQLGPERPPSGATWRQEKLLQRIHFGDRVPVVTCLQHRPAWDLNLTPTGQVYRSRGDWAFHPETIRTVLERMESDMAAGPAHFSERWLPAAVAQYAALWIDAPLPPALRARLGDVAGALSATAEHLPTSQEETYSLAARFYRAAGRQREAIAACQEALRLPGPHEEASWLLAETRYRARRKRGAPPIDGYLQLEMTRRHVPGLSVAVVRHGQVVLAKEYGLANVEGSVPATPDTVYELASVTKPFTAAAVMLLVEEGKLSLDDSLLKYRPDWPAAWRPITIRHLLTHTSGLRDYFQIPAFRSEAGFAWGRDYSLDQFLAAVSPLPLEFQPGDRYAYSNTGYYLLGMIIETVSHQPYEQFLTERIFQPLHMTATRRMDRRAIIPRRASGYAWGERVAGGSLENAEYTSATWAYAEGGLVSSVVDLARWDAALWTGQLLKRATLEQMFTPATLNNGKPTGYGLGWDATTDGSHPLRVSHGGSKAGFSTYLCRYLKDRLTVIVLANAYGAGANELAQGIAAFYLPAPEPLEDKDPATTRRLRRVLLDLAAGRADPPPLAAADSEVRPTTRQQVQRFYQSLGALKSFRLVEQRQGAQGHTYRYLSRFAEGAWIHTFAVTNAGEIRVVRVESDTR